MAVVKFFARDADPYVAFVRRHIGEFEECAGHTAQLNILAKILRKRTSRLGVALALTVLCQAGRGQSGSRYRDVAFWREPGVQVEYSSFQFGSRKAEEQIPCPVNHGADAAGALGPCHWQSYQFQHLPQWVWVHFAEPRRIDKVVLHAASMATLPVEFSGQYIGEGTRFHNVFHVNDAPCDPQTLTCTVRFAPAFVDNLRLVIDRTAANGGATPPFEYYFIQALYQNGMTGDAERLLWTLMESYDKGTFNAGFQLSGQQQRNPVGSALYVWDGSHSRGEGYLPEDWQGVDALFSGHFGVGFDKGAYFLEPWSPLKAHGVSLGTPYMRKTVERIHRSQLPED